MGKKHFCFFQTAETGNRTPNSGVKGSGPNHYPRAPAPALELRCFIFCKNLYKSIHIDYLGAEGVYITLQSATDTL